MLWRNAWGGKRKKDLEGQHFYKEICSCQQNHEMKKFNLCRCGVSGNLFLPVPYELHSWESLSSTPFQKFPGRWRVLKPLNFMLHCLFLYHFVWSNLASYGTTSRNVCGSNSLHSLDPYSPIPQLQPPLASSVMLLCSWLSHLSPLICVASFGRAAWFVWLERNSLSYRLSYIRITIFQAFEEMYSTDRLFRVLQFMNKTYVFIPTTSYIHSGNGSAISHKQIPRSKVADPKRSIRGLLASSFEVTPYLFIVCYLDTWASWSKTPR